ncbi:MAG TPA: GNAT family N-acetyltransferase [Gaiellaceae bacterium]|nr:GNAT family N-acetyltransferase [Gaiellaceae bacterium]
MELHPPDPPLADELVGLRPWLPEDVPAIVSACNDPETARWTTVPSPYSVADARAWIDRCESAWADGAAPFAVVERASGELAAAITLWVHGSIGELGYWAAPERRGHGYVPRAVRLLCSWAFDELALPRMQLGTLPGNASSERVAEKCGFTREGVLRAWLDQRGERRDVTMWSLLPGDSA